MVEKNKVIFFVNYYAGGAEKMTLNIASYLDADVYDVVFYIIGKDRGPISQFISKEARVEHINVQSYKDGLLKKLFQVIKKERPLYVFSSLMPINWRLCFAVSMFPAVNAVIRVNNYLHTQSYKQKIRLFLAYRFARSLIVQTEEMRNEHIAVLKLHPNKVITLANPVNIKSISKKLQDVCSPYNVQFVNYVFVGRVDPIKGLDVLLQSFALLLKGQANSRLYIVGETDGIFRPYYEKLLKLVKDLGVGSNVNFVGFSNNPYHFMKFADCLVLPSRNEGLPNVVIESLYLGTPVAVTTSVPIIARLIRNGVDGYLSPVDDVERFAFAMLHSAKLGRIFSIYDSATKEDFEKLFTN